MLRQLMIVACAAALSFAAALAQGPPDRNALLSGKETPQVSYAEAAGYPAPKAVLELASTLQLTDGQRRQLGSILSETHQRALELAKRIMGIEDELNNAFRAGLVNEKSVQDDAEQIGRLRGRLSGVFLAARVNTRKVLNANQLDLYKKLKVSKDSR
jgi:hypothetical protein